MDQMSFIDRPLDMSEAPMGYSDRIKTQADAAKRDAFMSEEPMGEQTYLVIESTPGYMPDTEPAEFATYAEAVEYANELADELEEQGYTTDRSWASRQNTYAIKAELPRDQTVAPDLGRYIEVIADEQ